MGSSASPASAWLSPATSRSAASRTRPRSRSVAMPSARTASHSALPSAAEACRRSAGSSPAQRRASRSAPSSPLRVGRRDDARAELVRATGAASAAAAYRRLLDELDTALLTAGKVELKRRGKPLIVACAARRIVLGRDPLCDLALRAGGVSRQHAEIERGDAGFALRDLDSRNGTSLAGMPLAGRVPLGVAGELGLGDECPIDYEVTASILVLRVRGGLDRGAALIAGAEDHRLDLTPVGLGLDLIFHRGRPLLGRGTCRSVTFNDEPLGDVRVQLIRKDRILADGEEIDVA